MKRWTIFLTTVAVALYLGSLSAFAQHGPGGYGGGGGHGAAAASHGNPNTSSSGGGKSSGASSKQLNNVVTSNPPSKLAQKLTSLLPAGTTLQQAATGFTNLGRFVAALHVYNNLGLASKTPPVSWTDFATAAQTKSLGAAIKQFDSTAKASSEAKRGTKQAKDDMKENS